MFRREDHDFFEAENGVENKQSIYKEGVNSKAIFVNVRRHKIRYHGKKCILMSLRDVSSSIRLDQETHNNKILKTLQSAVSRDLMTPLSCISLFVDLYMNRKEI